MHRQIRDRTVECHAADRLRQQHGCRGGRGHRAAPAYRQTTPASTTWAIDAAPVGMMRWLVVILFRHRYSQKDNGAARSQALQSRHSPRLEPAGEATMAIEHFEKLSIRSDPIEGGPVALEARADQSVLHHSGAQECPDEFQQLPGLRARRLLRQACGFLLVGGVAHLIFLALVHYDKPANQTRLIPVIPGGQKQSIVPTDKQPATISGDQNQSMFSIDKQPVIVPAEQNEATISGHSMHDARPEERSPDNLTSKPPDVAIGPLKNSALVSPDQNAVSPDQNTAVAANDGGYVVQVSAERSDAKAQASFKTLQSRYPHVLGRRSPLIRRVELGEKGIFYRAQIGSFDTVEQARRLCAVLKSAGAHCMVQKNS